MENRGICSRGYWYNKNTNMAYIGVEKKFCNLDDFDYHQDGIYFSLDTGKVEATKRGMDIMFDGYYGMNGEYCESHNYVTFALLNEISECFNLGYHSDFKGDEIRSLEFYHFIWQTNKYVHILYVDASNKKYMVDKINKAAMFGFNYQSSSSFVNKEMFNIMLSYFGSKYKELKVR